MSESSETKKAQCIENHGSYNELSKQCLYPITLSDILRDTTTARLNDQYSELFREITILWKGIYEQFAEIKNTTELMKEKAANAK